MLLLVINFSFDWWLHCRIYVCCISSSCSYLLNPFTILSCVAKSTCALNNSVIALFFLATIKGQMSFPIQASHHETHIWQCMNVKMENTPAADWTLGLCAGNVLLSAIFLAVATYQSIYPLSLCAPALLYFMQVPSSSTPSSSSSSYLVTFHFPVYLWAFPCPQRQYIPVNFRRASFWWFLTQYAFIYLGSLFVIIGLSFFLLGSWDYLESVYGFMWVNV